MLRTLALKALAAVWAISALAPGADRGATTALHTASTVPWTVPPFQSKGKTQCDSDGDLYFDVAIDISNPTVVMKVAHDGSKYEIYSLPSRPDVLTQIVAFSVTRSGELRVLALTRAKRTGAGASAFPYEQAEVSVYTYGDDPGNPSVTKLAAPEHMDPRSFAAFESGAVLVTGYLTGQAAPEQQGKTFTGVFQSSGKLAAGVSGNAGNVDLATLGKKIYEGDAVSGEDGFIYVLGPEAVVVVSESGAVVRKMPFKKPDSTFTAQDLWVSGGLAVIGLYTGEGPGKQLKVQYLAVNASTGEPLGWYEPEEALGNHAVCFSRSEGLTFLTVNKDGKFILASAPVR